MLLTERRTLGAGGPRISPIGLGTATWGATTDEEDAARQLKLFVRAGGNLLDTADVYAGGRSEEIIGRLLGKVVARSEIVLATKAGAVLDDPARRQDASARHLLAALDKSLAKLRTDHIDLWQLHAWDAAIPLEETLSAVDKALASGRVASVGVCNYAGWQTATAVARQLGKGAAPLVSAQLEYSLLERGIEREAVPAAADGGLGILAWAPLGRGVLTGKYRQGVPAERVKSRFFRWYVGGYLDDRRTGIVDAVIAAAAELSVPPLAVSLAWVRGRPGVAAPLVGARTVDQLAESLAPEAVALTLPDTVRERLDEVSAPYRGYPERGV